MSILGQCLIKYIPDINGESKDQYINQNHKYNVKEDKITCKSGFQVALHDFHKLSMPETFYRVDNSHCSEIHFSGSLPSR